MKAFFAELGADLREFGGELLCLVGKHDWSKPEPADSHNELPVAKQHCLRKDCTATRESLWDRWRNEQVHDDHVKIGRIAGVPEDRLKTFCERHQRFDDCEKGP